MLSKKLFQKPKNDLENYGRASREIHPAVPDELCVLTRTALWSTTGG